MFKNSILNAAFGLLLFTLAGPSASASSLVDIRGTFFLIGSDGAVYTAGKNEIPLRAIRYTYQLPSGVLAMDITASTYFEGASFFLVEIAA